MYLFAADQQASDLAPVPPDRLAYLQLCGARLDDIPNYNRRRTARTPAASEGILPLASLIAALLAGITVSVEIQQVSRGGVEAQRARVSEIADRCRRLLTSILDLPKNEARQPPMRHEETNCGRHHAALSGRFVRKPVFVPAHEIDQYLRECQPFFLLHEMAGLGDTGMWLVLGAGHAVLKNGFPGNR